MTVLTMMAYHIAAIELLYIAVTAWRYNGMATRGSGRFLGPFALAIAALVFRMDVYYICRVAFGVDLVDQWWWQPVVAFQAIVIAAMGGRVCWHLHKQLQASRELLRRSFEVMP